MQAVNISRKTLSALSRLSQALSGLSQRYLTDPLPQLGQLGIAGPWHKNNLLSFSLVPRRASPRPKARCPSLLSRGLSNVISKSLSTTSSTLQSILTTTDLVNDMIESTLATAIFDRQLSTSEASPTEKRSSKTSTLRSWAFVDLQPATLHGSGITFPTFPRHGSHSVPSQR